jgi:hypothetical protein
MFRMPFTKIQEVQRIRKETGETYSKLVPMDQLVIDMLLEQGSILNEIKNLLQGKEKHD